MTYELWLVILQAMMKQTSNLEITGPVSIETDLLILHTAWESNAEGVSMGFRCHDEIIILPSFSMAAILGLFSQRVYELVIWIL